MYIQQTVKISARPLIYQDVSHDILPLIRLYFDRKAAEIATPLVRIMRIQYSDPIVEGELTYVDVTVSLSTETEEFADQFLRTLFRVGVGEDISIDTIEYASML